MTTVRRRGQAAGVAGRAWKELGAMPIGFRCPRTELGCSAVYATTADLDNHTRYAHFYYGTSRFFASFGRVPVVEVPALSVSPRDTSPPTADSPVGEIGPGS